MIPRREKVIRKLRFSLESVKQGYYIMYVLKQIMIMVDVAAPW